LLVALLSAFSSSTATAQALLARSLNENSSLPGRTSEPRTEPADEAAQVQVAMDRFDSAIAAHDIARMQAIGVSTRDAKRWQSFFRNPGATVSDNCPASALVVSGDSASWVCTETATVINEGKPSPYAWVVHFTFVKRDGTWMIADRR
jgi:hypothetical protein